MVGDDLLIAIISNACYGDQGWRHAIKRGTPPRTWFRFKMMTFDNRVQESQRWLMKINADHRQA